MLFRKADYSSTSGIQALSNSCICAEVENHVELACALRDEIAKWATPLEEWQKLWNMPILVPKSQSISKKPIIPSVTWADYERWRRFHPAVIGPSEQIGRRYSPQIPPPKKVIIRSCMICGSPDYRWTDGTKEYCDSCWVKVKDWY